MLGDGLTMVPDSDLELLLKFLHRGEVSAPLQPADLARVGLQMRSEALMGVMRGLDKRGVHAVIAAVIAERRRSRNAVQERPR